MTASRRSPTRRERIGISAAALAALMAVGCSTPAGLPAGSAFLVPVSAAPAPPDVADRTAAQLARGALLSDPEQTRRALDSMAAIEELLDATDEAPTGLMGVALDLGNTTLDDRRAYRTAAGELLDRKHLDPALRTRLELFRDDAPLELAKDRIRDAWVIELGQAFNAVAEPVGRSIMTHKLAPYRLAASLLSYAVQVYTREALILQRRQALAHWKEFVRRNPEAPEVEKILPKVKRAQGAWHRMQRDRAMRVARRSLDAGRMRLALVYSDRALRHVPEDQGASELRMKAGEQLLEIREAQRRSLDAAPAELSSERPEESRALAIALLTPGGDVAGTARRLREADPEGPLADEARFAEAIALGEAGDDTAMWDTLEDMAGDDPAQSNMARHAAALAYQPDLNTWAAFKKAHSRERLDRLKWLLVGPFYRGPRPLGLPHHLDWVVQAPTIAQNVMGAPMRLLNLPWAKELPAKRTMAIHARRHIERYPDGSRTPEMRSWLENYEHKRGNYAGALALYSERPDADLVTLAGLREDAATQYLSVALREKNQGLRIGMYNQIGLSYPGSRAARMAGSLAAEEARTATAQRIRISKSYLLENPEVSGARGLGVRAELLDEDPTNGELHPKGVTLLGSRVVEVGYLAKSGDDDDPPRVVRELMKEDHLERVVSQLEETSYRNVLTDPDDEVGPDARRDRFFERVRLGLATQVDRRPGATSSYAYRGMRERFGMVRAREPILPFDLVVKGSINDLSFGAFPRIRPPKETPDAILFR